MSNNDLTRRNVIKTAGVLAALSGFTSSLPAQPPANEPGVGNAKAGGPVDRDFVIAAGMTEAEADCWETIAKAAGQYFALPEDHPMDKQEVASAIHIVQNKLLSRPTYRKYLELAKAAHEARNKQ